MESRFRKRGNEHNRDPPAISREWPEEEHRDIVIKNRIEEEIIKSLPRENLPLERREEKYVEMEYIINIIK